MKDYIKPQTNLIIIESPHILAGSDIIVMDEFVDPNKPIQSPQNSLFDNYEW